MRVEEPVGFVNQLFVEALLIDAGLVARNEQDAGPLRVKGERDPQNVHGRIGAEFLQIGVFRPVQGVGMGPAEPWPQQLQ